jgi:class 3 adenylate cyclase/tetratricopeptide (TPR) repeat protein
VICPSCGTENRAGRKFCVNCGSALAATCPNCGAAVESGERFCGECGLALPGAQPASAPRPSSAAPTVRTEVVAERRLVSVLFADLVGFTPYAAERDAEEVRETLSRYFELARDVVGRYGGTIEKFIGDAVMAVWGAPTTREDDAERAVRAALDLVDAVHVLGPGIQARAGVLTGEAAVTLGAVNEGMVAGDLVNTASRLQSVATPGTVFVGEATYRAASSAVAFEPVGEQTLKGKPLPVAAWRALRVVAEVGGRNRRESLEAPFVGRDDEFRLLKDLFHATARERRARLVSVVGPAGIGKSRLAWEFLKYIDGLVETVWWHDGRSPAYGSGITFWALGEMVRGRAGLLESDDEAVTRAKITESVREHVPDEVERAWIEPALLALLGIEARIASEQLFAAWRTFFERLAATAPVVMVFEDLHFADDGLLDFVDHLLEWSRSVPIYVLTLARPELIDRRPTWGAGKRNFTSVYLDPLPPDAMRQLLRGLVPGLPESGVRAIVARADGIPLYAVETVRSLVADGRLELQDGVYAPIGDLTSLTVPETLTALIASRLDALPPAERSVVSDAAVLGQSFTVAALAAIAGRDEEQLEELLRTLNRRELLTVDVDPRSPERGQYRFVQALIREVAYNTLTKRDRKVRHLAAARFFESLGTDELAGALAGQYLAAYASAPEGAEADALAAQARLALRGAAERALALGSPEQASSFLQEALGIARDPAEVAELTEQAGLATAAAGHYERAEELLLAAIERNRERGDRQGAARTTAAAGRAMLTARRTDAALELLEPAAAEFVDLLPDPAAVAIDGQLARAFYFMQEYRRALEIADRTLEAAEHGDLIPIIADTLVTKGSALAATGRAREAMGVIRAGEQLAREHGLSATLLRALNNRSVMEDSFDPRSGMEAAREGLALARRTGDRGWMAGLQVGVGYSSFLFGDWDAALEHFRAGLAEEPELSYHIQLLANLIDLRAYRGEDVRADLAELERLGAGMDDFVLGASLIDTRAFVATAGGSLADAADLFREESRLVGDQSALSLYMAARPALWLGDRERAAADLADLDATGIHGPVVECRRATIRAGLLALDGRTAEALAGYRDVLARWEGLGLVLDKAMTAIDMATLIGPGEGDVTAAVADARAFLERVGATPFLERLDAAMAATGDRATRMAPASPAEAAVPAGTRRN